MLITVLVVAFFSSVTTERTSSNIYAQGVAVKGLAESAVQTVMGTIQNATSRGANVAWASQPGMIRTYGTPTVPSGVPSAYYKLYSSGNMVVTGTALQNYQPEKDPSDIGGNRTWYDQKAYFTDLNEPVATAGGSVYPIVDPISDPPPQDDKTSPVSGFSVKDPPLAAVGTLSITVNPVPMPVRWLYQLRDGTLTAPDDPAAAGSTTVALFTKAPAAKQPSATNPIVGRIAFWTDDETCKVNVNTSAGDLSQPALASSGTYATGSFWDMPRANTAMDRYMVTSQALTDEFQRYPGHPATVSLNAVFKNLTRDNIGTIAPRIASADKGSAGGTVATSPSGTDPSGKILRDSDRLYASVDELMFQPTSTGGNRSLNPVPSPDPITNATDLVSKRRFFLTANSRAPEVTLFGAPRVGIWPLSTNTDNAHRTPIDRYIAFCDTVGAKEYYFARSAPNSRTKDYDEIPRNQKLYAYLQNMTGKAFPGFGGSGSGFVGKYGGDRDQILTEIFDYIRTVNASDPLVGVPYTPRFLDPNVSAGAAPRSGVAGSGMVAPIKIVTPNSTTKGFGRIDTFSEAAICFCASENYPAGTTNVGRPSKIQAYLLLEHFNPAAGPAGYVPNYVVTVTNPAALPNRAPVSFTVKMGTYATQTLTFSSTLSSTERSNALGYGRFFGSTQGPMASLLDKPYVLKSNYPFLGEVSLPAEYLTVPLPATSSNLPTFTMGAFSCDVTISLPDTGEVVQILHMSFPSAEIPLPQRNPSNRSAAPLTFRAHAVNLTNNPASTMIFDDDVIRSVEAAGTRPSADSMTNPLGVSPGSAPAGDYRLMAAREEVPVNYFTRHENYYDKTAYLVHSFRSDDRDQMVFHGEKTSPFVGPYYKFPSSTTLNTIDNSTTTVTPDFPTSIGVAGAGGNNRGALMFNGHAGDWDTGMSNMADGAYINKADEGASNAGGGGGTSSDSAYYGALQTNGGALFSANREMPSAVMFGSLSTGVVAEHPWQTLLFHPDFGATPPHPGLADPPDHLLLDLFTMPVAEPYPISEPLSTAGRINMNYRIAPFSYITRNTALRAALDPVWMMAIPSDDTKYKLAKNTAVSYRYPVNANETLLSFEDRFDLQDAGDTTKRGLFVSASEVCTIPLVPADRANGGPLSNASKGSMSTWWGGFQRTGDNVREMPYNHLYPLLTTRSNTYTVHYRVQTLRKVLPPTTAATDTRWAQWDETRDQVTAAYRGSSVIERYVDPGDPTLPDFADPVHAPDSLDHYKDDVTGNYRSAYKFRVLSTKQFAPQ